MNQNFDKFVNEILNSVADDPALQKEFEALEKANVFHRARSRNPSSARPTGATVPPASTESDAPESTLKVGPPFDIPLNDLEDGPFQLRDEIDSEEIESLAEDIRRYGLYQPIMVRPAGKKFQIVFGHRRVQAMRRLRFAAKTEEEKERYSAISARQLAGASDQQTLLMGMAENMKRSDISPVAAGRGLLLLQQVNPNLKTAEQIAELVAIPRFRVQRSLRLARAPRVIQDAVSKGIELQDEPEKPRTLDPTAAGEFIRLHEHFLQRNQGNPDAEQLADELTGKAINSALSREWGFRRMQKFVDDFIRVQRRRRKRGDPSPPAPAFKRSKREVVIYPSRLEDASSGERKKLKALLLQLLQALEKQDKTARDQR